MADKNKYLRKFIILDNKEVDSLKGSNPKGYVKIEARDGKGKMLFNVEGLERSDRDKRNYRGYLLSNSQGRILHLDVGSIITNEKGKGSLEWQFNPDSVGDTKLPIEAFNVVLIKLGEVEGSDIGASIPLAGYIQDNDGTIATMARELKKENKHVHYEEKVKEVKEEPKEQLQLEYDEGYIKEKQPQTEEQEVQVKEVQVKEVEIEEGTEEVKIEEVEIEEVEKQLEEKIELEADEELKPMESLEAKPVEDMVGPDQYKSEYTEEDKSQFIDIEDNFDQYFIDVKSSENIEEQEYAEEDTQGDTQEDIHPDIAENGYEETGGNLNYDYDKETYGYSVNQGYDYIENARNYSKQIANYTMNILKFFQKVNPFNEGLEEYTWWEIEYDRKNIFRGFLPFYNYIVSMYYPYPAMTKVTTCQNLIQKYDHYIFGTVESNKEVKYYVYGIPGRFTKEEQPYKGMTGFQTWLRRKGRNRDDIGYWLIHIDAVSGKIVNPLPPTPIK